MKVRIILILVLSVLLIGACAIRRNPTVFVDVFITSYTPAFNTAAYQDYKGKPLVLDSIRNEAANTTMLGYYGQERSIRYTTNFSPDKSTQPLESFLWYALQKSFTHAGITASNDAASDTTLELRLIIASMDDQEAKFQMQLMRGGKLLAQKDVTVTQPPSPTSNAYELETRAYAYIDAITVAILDHPDFKKELLTLPEKPVSKDAIQQ